MLGWRRMRTGHVVPGTPESPWLRDYKEVSDFLKSSSGYLARDFFGIVSFLCTSPAFFRTSYAEHHSPKKCTNRFRYG
ncbi:hypothetical protein CDAR_499191 [Caerostris darwini]|uniref:Uncharacterized protein n=1 Tax=Caerostris darwini TaxID=1538125 RepID=A0AAV4PHF5_9ARAC|nr:hypothetical protein CDAR_499191 [Caerostris darwini]